jgi:hypothetical protein
VTVAETTVTEMAIFEVLHSSECACHKAKPLGFAFCGTCFFVLPRELKEKLYNVHAADYAESYAAALAFLRQKGAVA